jgi:signal transduction histidine kinase/CheY-like chemotaxis protein
MPHERVLIVDDEEDVLDLCRRLLEAEGYQVRTASDGFEAVQRARAETLDLLLTDIKMPGISGLEMAQMIKEIDSNIVCVTMTGYSTMSTAIEALRLGVDEFIIKPFTPDELLSAITKALEKVRLRRENIRLRALIPLFELSKVFLSTVNEAQILDYVVKIAQEETRSAGAMILLADPQSATALACRASGNLDQFEVISRNAGWPVPWEVMAHPAETALSISLPQQEPANEHGDLDDIGPLIGCPIRSQDGPIGALLVAREPAAPHYQQSDLELLAILSGQAGIAISNARLFAQIQRSYDEMKKLSHMKSEFINIAAHELRTPLAILMGYASILAEEANGETRERLDIVVRNAMRLRAIIDDMLNLRHLERGELLYNPETLRVGEVLQTVVADLLPLARDKGLIVEVAVRDNLPAVSADRQKLEAIIANLFSNAIKFTRPGGRIELSAERQNDSIVLHVADTGVGIPPDALERIFEPFFQVEESLTREQGGLGLGLTIAKSMAERCGGCIQVESVLGKGSRFSLILPAQAG